MAIVDDEECVRTALAGLLRSVDVHSDLFESGLRLLEHDLSHFTLVLSDIQMPGLSGIELLDRIHSIAPDLPVALMTAFPDAEWRQRALEKGAYRFLAKPLDADAVIAMIEGLLGGAGQA
ncbi:response regulator [Novosphingobium sp. PhB165]|uniref:response regulator n=1 Tax=Novosphingobium sp. PhB165 TaxID=2485105 RepID=UPI001404C0EB|nr:response regulator [Novosphingobium sp. PhB165]